MATPGNLSTPTQESMKREHNEHSEHWSSTLPPEPPSESAIIGTGRSKTNSKSSHDENHSDYGNVVRDVIIGFADGLTVPFALTAGLSSCALSLPHHHHINTVLMKSQSWIGKIGHYWRFS